MLLCLALSHRDNWLVEILKESLKRSIGTPGVRDYSNSLKMYFSSQSISNAVRNSRYSSKKVFL